MTFPAVDPDDRGGTTCWMGQNYGNLPWLHDEASTWVSIFDQTRATGGERYQGMRVRINDLTLLSTSGWNATNPWGNRLCTVTDGLGRFFSLRHPCYDLGPAPAGMFTEEHPHGSESIIRHGSSRGRSLLPQTSPSTGVNR